MKSLYVHDETQKESRPEMLCARLHKLREVLNKTVEISVPSVLESEGRYLIDEYGYKKLATLIARLESNYSSEARLTAMTLITFLERRCADFVAKHNYQPAYSTLKKAKTFAEIANYYEILPLIDFNLGHLSFSFLQEYDKAIYHFGQAIDRLKARKRRMHSEKEFDPRELANSYRWRAYAYLHKGLGKKALKDFQKAIGELRDLTYDSEACAIIADCYESAHLLIDDELQAAKLQRQAIDFKKKAVENTIDPFWKCMSQARVAQIEDKIPEVLSWYDQALRSARTEEEKRLVRALLFLFSGRAATREAVTSHDIKSLVKASEYNEKAYKTYPIVICKNCWHLYQTLKLIFSELEEMNEEQFDDIIRRLQRSKENFIKYHGIGYSQLIVMLNDLSEMISKFKTIRAKEDLSLRRELAEKIQERGWSIIITANSVIKKTPLSLFTESIAKKIIQDTASMASLPIELRELWFHLSQISSVMAINDNALLSILGIVRECTVGIEEHKRLGTGFIIGDRNDLASILSTNNVGISLPSATVSELRNEISRYFDVVDGTNSCFLVDKEGKLLGAAFLNTFRKVTHLNPAWSDEYIAHFSLTSHLPIIAIITPRSSKSIKIFRNGKMTFELTYFEKWRKWSFRNMGTIIKITSRPLRQRKISREVFLRILTTAQLMSERRIGGSFVLGDHETVLCHSETPRIRFEVKPNVLSISNESILSFAKQENAVVVSSEGSLEGASVRLRGSAHSKNVVFQPDDGNRHKTTIEMTVVADRSVGIVVSENGPISICAAGKRVLPAF